jgi:Phage integrase family
LRFFFRVTLKRYAIVEHTRFIHELQRLPVVLSQEEVVRLLDAAPGLKYKEALSVAYGAGLRASEVISLKVSDIDSKRMVIRVEQGNTGRRCASTCRSNERLERGCVGRQRISRRSVRCPKRAERDRSPFWRIVATRSGLPAHSGWPILGTRALGFCDDVLSFARRDEPLKQKVEALIGVFATKKVTVEN